MDEPLSNLDAKLRNQMRVELRRIHDELGTTTVYVTHDQVEAMTLADRIAVMDEGSSNSMQHRCVLSSPLQHLRRLIPGRPPMNLVRGSVHDGVFTSEHGEMTLTLGDVGG